MAVPATQAWRQFYGGPCNTRLEAVPGGPATHACRQLLGSPGNTRLQAVPLQSRQHTSRVCCRDCRVDRSSLAMDELLYSHSALFRTSTDASQISCTYINKMKRYEEVVFRTYHFYIMGAILLLD